MTPKVFFEVADKGKISEFVFDLKNSLEVKNLSQRNYSSCIHCNFPKILKKKIISYRTIDANLRNEIIKYVDISKDEIKKMKFFIFKLEEYWNNLISNLFFLEMQNNIGNFLGKKYICYITNKVVGAYFNDREITIDYKEEMSVEKSSFILAEEILHLIYWQCWKRIYKRNISNIDEIFSIKGKKWSCWHIAEIIPEYLLVNNPSFEKFGWDKRKRYLGYTWIPEIRKILDSLWDNKKDFKDFIIKAHIKLKCLP